MKFKVVRLCGWHSFDADRHHVTLGYWLFLFGAAV